MIYPTTDISEEILAASVVAQKNADDDQSDLWLLFKRLSRLWSSLHVSYNIPLLRVVLVCLGALLPAQLFIIAQEVVPLEDPSLGWQAKNVFWVRAAIVVGACTSLILAQAKYLVKYVVIPRRLFCLFTTSVVSLQIVVVIAVAACVCFPIPFTILAMAPAFNALMGFSLYAVFGPHFVRQILQHKDELIRFMAFFALQQLVAIVYPAYQVLFEAARDTKYESPVVLLLPIIKLALKNIILLCLTHMEDMLPEAVIFTLDFFNSLYLSTSMESSTSTQTVVIIVAIDVVQSASVLFKLHRRTSSLLATLNETLNGQVAGDTDLVSGACCLYRTDVSKSQNRKGIRAHSCLPHSVWVHDQKFLNQHGNTRLHGPMDMLRLQSSSAPSSIMLVNTTKYQHPHKLSFTESTDVGSPP